MQTQNRLLLSQPSAPIVWRLLIALAIIQGIFTLSWVIYRAHLATVLTHSGFSAQDAPQLLLVEALIAIALEPIIGQFCAHPHPQRGTRLPWLAVGLGLSAGLLIAIAAWVVVTQPTSVPQWGMIGLLVAWAIAMSLFRTPAIALLYHCATPRYLPQAASILTLVGGVTGAAATATPIIRSWGAGFSFVIAALGLVGLWFGLNWFGLKATALLPLPKSVTRSGREAIAHPSLFLHLSLIFALGFTTTAVLRLVVETFPTLLKASLPSVNPASMLALMFITVAFTALPSGIAAVRFGNRQTMLVGLGALLASLGIMTVPSSPFMAVIAAIALGSSLALVSNGTLPFALASVSANHAGLAVGMFFGGAAAAISCLGIFGRALAQSGIAPIWLGGAALLVAALCITVPFRSLDAA